MAEINGLLQNSLIVQPLADRTYLSPNVLQVNDSTFAPAAIRLASPEIGTPTYQPTTVLYDALIGVPPIGVNSFLYGRFIRLSGATILDGDPIDVGVLRESDSVSQTIWNGFKIITEITSIAYSYPSSGVTVTGPIVGEVFNPYEERPLNIIISISGDAHFDVEITISFDNGESYVFSVRGDRLPQKEFTFLSQANWRGGLQMKYEYLTSIYKASETSETRQALRPRPVRSMTYEFAAVGENFSTVLWGFMQGLAKRRTLLPLFQDGAVVTQLSTGSVIHCDTTYRRFYAGQTLLIALRRYDRSHTSGTGEDEAMYYTAMIASVASDRINVISLPVAELPKGTMVYPAITSEIAIKDNDFEVFKPTGAIAQVDINEVFGVTTLPAANSAYSPTTYYGDAYFGFDWNWISKPKVGLLRDSVKLKGGRYSTVLPRTGFSTATLKGAVSVHTRAEWWDLIGFLNYVKGRFKPYWIKHPMDVYRLGTYILFDGADVTEVEVQTQGGINNMFSCQAIWTKDSNGTETIIKVTGIRAGFTDQSVILELDPTVVVDIVELKRAFLVRNTSDNFTENWKTDEGVVEVRMSMIELPGGYS